ncbi:MAG: low molecular weight phosphotyrosine protein phosphatase, partial [Oscillatoriales cyanobacterium SM2_1_8]|nr:low molecular weight phosphotyrosine protein phosphatase [Oscillatoriales cyanobacterium SM2_1_8]
MQKVLFVCLGNICRSPAAENLFNHLLQQKGWQSRIACDSAGTAGYHTGPPD